MPNQPTTARTPREVARGLALTWNFLQDLNSAPTAELAQRRDTLLALMAASTDGKRGKFPGTALLEQYQTELARRARRFVAHEASAALHRRRLPDGPYAVALAKAEVGHQPKKYSQYL